MDTKQRPAIRWTRTGTQMCHCGANMDRSDHCPCCGCEEHERVCSATCPNPRIRIGANHADRCWK